MKTLFILMFISVSALGQSTVDKCSCDSLFNDSANNVYLLADEMPKFIGGELALINFVKGYKSPDNSISCKVVLYFIINCEGKVCDFKAVHQEGNITEKDISNLILYLQTMPKWNAAKVKGKLVDSRFTLPINIKNGYVVWK